MKTIATLLFTAALISTPASAADIQLGGVGGFNIQSGGWDHENAEITGAAEPGKGAWLISDQTFADFDLELEYNTSTALHVVVRGHTLPTGPVPVDQPADTLSLSNYGYSIAPGAHEETTIVHGPAGSSSDETRIDETLHGSWTTLRIQARGNSLTASRSDSHETQLVERTYTSGWIGFCLIPDASNAATVRIRNIKLTDLGRTGDWIPLFNGNDFDNWVQWGTETWTVKDGIIEGTSGPDKSEGYLATKETWSDFHVRGTFKILGDGNYGLFYHSTIAYDDKQYPIISGIQTEVAPGTPSPSGWLYESYKRGWLGEPDMTNPAAYALNEGEWNEIEVLARGNRVISWVNGIQVVDFTDATPNYSEGAFALQLHAGGAEGILWKDLFVKKD